MRYENGALVVTFAALCAVGCSENVVGSTAVLECDTDASVCERLHGPPPCGAWECNNQTCEVVCAGCDTDADFDGFGPEPGCAGMDCDDADDQVGDTASRSCYNGAMGTENTGACVGGTETCSAGVWDGVCAGEVVPRPERACDGVDDDCNGAVDDDPATDADCVTQNGGQPACPGSSWTCNAGTCQVTGCMNCTDADLDGFGMGMGCAGPDCDDNDPTVQSTGMVACYTGPAGTDGVGACRAGLESCTGGMLSGVCVGEVTPAATELCNGIDDTCDGSVDGTTDADNDCTAQNGGPPACMGAAWACSGGACIATGCPCSPDADSDGYGPGMGCVAPDCDDNDPTIRADGDSRACYTGAPGTVGIGICRAGTETCVAGSYTPCTGEVTPSPESCNDEDDDCNLAVDDNLGNISCGVGVCANTVTACLPGGVVNTCLPNAPSMMGFDDCGGGDADCDGAIDEDCVANCVWVSASRGDDMTGDGSVMTPYQTIQAGIMAADPTMNEFVCVTAPDCMTLEVYDETIVMRDGIHVYGDWDDSSSGPRTRCNTPPWPTQINPSNPPIGQPSIAVLFDASVQSTTIIDGFEINRAGAVESTGVTIDGSFGAVVNNMNIEFNGNGVVFSYGVNFINGAVGSVTDSKIMGGDGSSESMGVRSVGSRPTLRGNCDRFDGNNRCDIGCGGRGTPNRSIRGPQNPGFPPNAIGTYGYAVYLEDSPGAVVEQNSICNAESTFGAGVRITGDATGTIIRANSIFGWASLQTFEVHSIWIDDCLGASPWFVDNVDVMAWSGFPLAAVDGIRSTGDCHPRIDSNDRIIGGVEGGAAEAHGVYCTSDASGSSRCVITDNLQVQGSGLNFPPLAVGVRCDAGACARIAGNAMITGSSGMETYGVWLESNGTVVENNVIEGGCGPGMPTRTGASQTGLYAHDSFGRVINNVIRSGFCRGGPVSPGPVIAGMHIQVEDSANEMNVQNNIIDGAGDSVPCTSYGIWLDRLNTAPPTARGNFRNNIIAGGRFCETASYGVWEARPATDPRVFENNLMDDRVNMSVNASGLYVDENDFMNGVLNTAMAIDGMTDITVSGTVVGDPLLGPCMPMPNPWGASCLTMGSPADNAGTPAGAPGLDFQGDARSATTPDIGPDEN